MGRKLRPPALDPGQPGAAPEWARYYRARAQRSYRRARKDQRHADWVRTLSPAQRGRIRAPEWWEEQAAQEREWARWCADQAREFERKHRRITYWPPERARFSPAS